MKKHLVHKAAIVCGFFSISLEFQPCLKCLLLATYKGFICEKILPHIVVSGQGQCGHINTPSLHTVQCIDSCSQQQSIFIFYYFLMPSLKACTHCLQVQCHAFGSTQFICKCSKSQATSRGLFFRFYGSSVPLTVADGSKCLYIWFCLSVTRSDPTSEFTQLLVWFKDFISDAFFFSM